MTIVGSVELLVVGFDGLGPLPPDVDQRVEAFVGRGIIRVLDVLCVSKDEHGDVRVVEDAQKFGLRVSLAESTLWQLFDGGDPAVLPEASFELHSAREVGLDIDAVESLAQRIAPGTSALLMLVEPTWANDLVETVFAAGGLPIAFGCLEPETMLIVGPHVASAVLVAQASESIAAVRGAATLDALARTQITSTAAEVIKSLVVACLLDASAVEDAIGALATAGLLPPAALARARKQADAALSKILRIGPRPGE